MKARLPAVSRALASGGFGLTRILGSFLPRSWLYALGWAAAPVLYGLIPGLRRALLANASHILGEASTPALRRRLAIGVLRSFSRFTIEVITAHRGLPVDEKLFDEMAGRENFDRAREAGRGIIAVTLHMGNYEAGPMLLARYVQPLAMVYNRDPARIFEGLRSRRRREQAILEIPIDRSPLFGIEALAVLRNQGIVLLAADIGFDAPGAGDLYDFLGAKAPFLSWPARLSLASRAPVLPCFIVRDARERYRLEVAPPILPGSAGDDRGGAIEATMTRLVAVFEEYVRRYPEQWLIIHPYWPADGKGAAA